MMAPACTIVPSNTLTPSRWAFESRPLRVEPPPLVLDICFSYAFAFDCLPAEMPVISTTS